MGKGQVGLSSVAASVCGRVYGTPQTQPQKHGKGAEGLKEDRNVFVSIAQTCPDLPEIADVQQSF